MKYAIEQYYYDNGNIHVMLPIEVSDNCKEIFEMESNKKNCSYYRDIFNTFEEAEEFYQECLEA